MKYTIILLPVLIASICNGQLTSLVMRNDTLFSVNPTTGVYTQITRTASSGVSSQTVNDSLNAIRNTANTIQAAVILRAPIASPTFTGIVSGVTATMVGLGNVSNTSDAAKPVSTATQTALDLKAPLASPTFTGTVVLPASASLITPIIGAATGTSLGVTASIGYTTGAGGAVTQNANKTTGVTLNKICGAITMNNAALTAGSEAKFTVTNSTVAATDVVIVSIKSGGTSGSYLISVSAVAAGSFDIVISNVSAGSLSEAVVISFAVIKAVAN